MTRDFNPLNVYNIEYMVDNSNLGLLATDSEENIMVFMYQPESRESYGGQKLIRKCDYHLGQKINAMFRVQCRLNDLHRLRLSYENKHVVMFGKRTFINNTVIYLNKIINNLFKL